MSTTEWFALFSLLAALAALLATLLAAVIAAWVSINKQVASLKKDVALLRSNDLKHIRDELVTMTEKLDRVGEHEIRFEEVDRRLAAIEGRGK